MADFNFTPTDGLLDTAVFPSNPTSEAQARQQFMTLFNQIRDYINTMEVGTGGGTASNADTVDGKHASEFSLVGHNHNTAYSAISHNHDTAYSAASHRHDTLYLGVNGTAVNSSKISGKQVFIQQAQPTAANIGDIWIAW